MAPHSKDSDSLSDQRFDAKGPELEEHENVGGLHSLRRRLSTGVTADDVLNPLSSVSRHHLMAEADAFVDNFGFQADRDIFRRGALVAQRPKQFEYIDGLSDDDKTALASERDHIWRQPRALIVSGESCRHDPEGARGPDTG